MNNTPLKEVKERMDIFTNGHRQAQHDAADLIESICKAMDFDKDHCKRVRNAVLGKPRKKIRFSDARKMLGIGDVRAWKSQSKKDPRYASIEIMWATEKSAYCWEDEVIAVLANVTGERHWK